MATSIVVVTGANLGLGYWCAQGLVDSNKVGFVVMACRNISLAEKAADSIAYASTNKFSRENIIVLPEPCDLCDISSVRKFAAALKVWLSGRKIYALVNNAGIGGFTDYVKNALGHDKTFATNHLGHFLLSILLLPCITDRIINVGSGVHDPSIGSSFPDPELGYPTNESEYNSRMLCGEPLIGENELTSGRRRYSRSKLCNVFFTNELAFRLSGE